MAGKQLCKLAPVVALFLLGGCISFGGKVPPTLFDLKPERVAPAGVVGSGLPAEAIVVREPETGQRLAVTRVPVQVDAANVAYLKDAAWVEKPSALFRNLLAETIRAKGGRLVFVDDETLADGKLRLSGRLLDMGYDARSESVVVRFDAIRESGGVMEVRRFEATESGVGSKPAQIGPALNRAANNVAVQVADWIG